MKEKTIKSELVYKGKILNLRVDKVVLPNGRETKREIIEHSGSVAILPLISRDKFLFVKQFRKPIEKTLLEVPAGRIEKGEKLKECARRELMEETSYETSDFKKLASVYLSPGYSSEIIHILLARNLKKSKSNPDDDEFIKTVILNKKEVFDKIIDNKIKDSKTIVSIFLFLYNECSFVELLKS